MITAVKSLFVLVFGAGVWILMHSVYGLISNRYPFSRKRRFAQRAVLVYQTMRRPLTNHVQQVISVSGHSFSAEAFVVASLIFLFPGFYWGYTVFQSALLGSVFGAITVSLPTLYILFHYHKRQKHMNSLMLPTLQIFLGIYSSNPNVRHCLQQCIGVLPSYMRYEFQVLTNSLHTGTSFEEALSTFGARVGNPFAEDFADLLIIAEERGENIQESLMNLINRIQTDQFHHEMERTELIDIRYGTMVIVGLTVFLIGYNIRLGQSPFKDENTILQYYTSTSGGHTVIAAVAAVQFVSLLGSFWVGRRRI